MNRQVGLILLLLLTSCNAATEESWLGKKVFVKDDFTARIGVAGDEIKPIPGPAAVEEVDGVWLRFGRLWIHKKDVMLPKQAVAYYSQRIKNQPGVQAWWNNRATAWIELGELDNAMNDLNEAIQLDPLNTPSYINRADLRRMKGDYENAIKDANEAVRLDPTNEACYCFRGVTRIYKGDYDGGIEDLSQAIRIDPSKAVNFYNRGNAFSRKGNYENAVKDFTETIRLAPQNSMPFSGRGYAWLRTGKYDNAINDFNQAIVLNPRDADAYEGLAALLSTCPEDKFRDGKKAVEFATKSCELSEWKNWVNIRTLAAAYAETSEFAKAVTWQTKANEMANEEKYKQEGQARLELYKIAKPFRREPYGKEPK